ncbi:hypothetical protein LOTGIDRAFT_171195 [Lottia gigantea]|uniref:Uncharacterized protein n=1 Tax=Lottia gigantea TaxID=225164 RepID=V4AHW6_LOTGI|nr:hypothetical protein LOTGIDRAFT_171195 [Lottia gigantea]ESP03664.1 hypothetical protein LOTGIDRAFT_171195 [Lottia gigantea]
MLKSHELVLILASQLVLVFSNFPPNPTYLQTASGGQFSVQNHDGVKSVSFTYSVDSTEEKTVFARLFVDDIWRQTVTNLTPDKNLCYFSTMYFHNGNSVSETQEWKRRKVVDNGQK